MVVVIQDPSDRSRARPAPPVHQILKLPNSGGELAVGADGRENSGGGQADVVLCELPARAGEEGVAVDGDGAGDCVLGGADAAGDVLRGDVGAEGRYEFDGC